jgi:hypothetical protein
MMGLAGAPADSARLAITSLGIANPCRRTRSEQARRPKQFSMSSTMRARIRGGSSGHEGSGASTTTGLHRDHIFHHAIGTAAGELHDSSKVLEHDRPRRLALEVRFRPTGVARVEIEVTPDEQGSRIDLAETPTGGPLLRLPRVLSDPVLSARNFWSLRRLRHEVERSSHEALGSLDL